MWVGPHNTSTPLTLQTFCDAIGDAIDSWQDGVFEDIRGRQRKMRRCNAYRRPIEVVEGFVCHDRHYLGAPTAQPRVLFNSEQPVRLRYRAQYRLRVEWH